MYDKDIQRLTRAYSKKSWYPTIMYSLFVGTVENNIESIICIQIWTNISLKLSILDFKIFVNLLTVHIF